IPVIRNLLGKADTLLLGGGMAYTFLRAQGLEVGRSLVDPERVVLARQLLEEAKNTHTRVLLPVDVVVAPEIADDVATRVVPVTAIPEDMMGLDIGPRTIDIFVEHISRAGTIVWNGPMGVFEKAPFQRGTREVAAAMAKTSAITIIGGGDSAAAGQQFGFAEIGRRA